MLITLFSLLLHLSFLQHPFAYEDPRNKHCGSTTSFKYTPNSTFAYNLNEAFNILNKNTSPSNFNSTTYSHNGTAPVTALALCRGDLTPSECQPCIEAATADILTQCPFHSSAEIWYNFCMMRNSGKNFLTTSDDTVIDQIWDDREVPDAVYDEKVQQLSLNLSVSAGESSERFAVGWTSAADGRKLHGYQECSRDLTDKDCTDCLMNARSTIDTCCLGKWAGWILTRSCQIRFNLDQITNDSHIVSPEIFTSGLVAPPGDVKDGNGTNWGLVVGVIVGVVMVVIFASGGLWLYVVKGKRKRKTQMKRRESRDEEEDGWGDTTIDGVGAASFVFNFEILATATENFAVMNRLGSGGFGTVYKGMMANGKEIAVKKLAIGSDQGVEEFSNEVLLLLRMQHRNLVKLLGCCVQGEDRLLVYEYLQNKSLDNFLFDKSKSAVLDWSKRFNIIVGVARGLLYLHEDSQLRIVHRDIKASNILLDEKMNPKIADFGLARLFPDEITQLRTRRIAGTIGYMAPEYAVRGLLSAKSDVFSFGILMLEIISGRKNYNSNLEEQDKELLNFSRRLEREGRLMELVDVTAGSSPEPEVLKCIHIGLSCCQSNIKDRPTMASIVLMLSSDSVTSLTENRNQSLLGSNSINTSMTITLVSGR